MNAIDKLKNVIKAKDEEIEQLKFDLDQEKKKVFILNTAPKKKAAWDKFHKEWRTLKPLQFDLGNYKIEDLANLLVHEGLLSDKQMVNLDEGYSHKAGFMHLFDNDLDSHYWQMIDIYLTKSELIDLMDRVLIPKANYAKTICSFITLSGSIINYESYKSQKSYNKNNSLGTPRISALLEKLKA